MRYKIYYMRWTHIRTLEGLKSLSTLEYLKTVDANELDKEMKELFGKYVSLWVKPVE